MPSIILLKYPTITRSRACFKSFRRQIKPHKDSISFVGLLEKIRQTPSVLSRERFVSLHLSPEKIANDLFDEKFAGECADHIDPVIVRQDLCTLKACSAIVEKFADDRVAHLGKRKQIETPTFDALNDCIDCLAELIRKYYLLFEAKELDKDLLVDFTDDWKGIFHEQWIVSDTPDAPM